MASVNLLKKYKNQRQTRERPLPVGREVWQKSDWGNLKEFGLYPKPNQPITFVYNEFGRMNQFADARKLDFMTIGDAIVSLRAGYHSPMVRKSLVDIATKASYKWYRHPGDTHYYSYQNWSQQMILRRGYYVLIGCMFTEPVGRGKYV